MDEFDEIARLFRPLTWGAPEALDLLDDAAVIPSRPGFELVVTQDAMVAGVHFLDDDPPDLVARKLLRVNLSDLAAKAAEPYGYFLSIAWPVGWGPAQRDAFAAGLRQDQEAFGLRLFGGDTVSTPGPLTASVTLMGWTPAGRTVRRSGARPGDVVLVSGAIGDGGLGLRAARGELAGADPLHVEFLSRRFHLPQPRLALREVLRAHASACADVSDGLLADAGHIGQASRVGVSIDLDRIPVSEAGRAWLETQPDDAQGRLELASLGDDYELVCTARPTEVGALTAQARGAGVSMTVIGGIVTAPGLSALHQGVSAPIRRTGWSHL